MPKDHVRDLVGENASQFALIVGGLDGAQIHIHGSARQGEGIDILFVYHVETERPLHVAGSMRGKRLPELLDILRYRARVRQHGHSAVHFGSGLLSELDVLLWRELIKGTRFQLESAARRLLYVLSRTASGNGQRQFEQCHTRGREKSIEVHGAVPGTGEVAGPSKLDAACFSGSWADCG